MQNDLDPVRREVLDKIASGEAPGYNVLFGGSTFDDFSDHPRQSFDLGDGTHTTAAGRYQFLSSTWDSEARKLGLTDFSPGSQDQAAWDLADSTYRRETGRDLAGDAKAGAINWQALSGQWPSLAGRKGPKAENALGASPVEAGAKPLSSAPSESLASVLQLLSTLAPQHKFTPVEYDPFAFAPKPGEG